MMTQKEPYHIISFYQFVTFSQKELLDLNQSLQMLTNKLHIKGLILIGQEGINGTIAGSGDAISHIKSFLDEKLASRLSYKESLCGFLPFKRMKVKVKKEIIKMKLIDPKEILEKSIYLSPKKWHNLLKQSSHQKNKSVLLDVRNWYETQLGSFPSSHILNIKTFAEFSDQFKKLGLKKDQPIYTFCTGGIRCEKACMEMQKMGYKYTYQLQGGILGYLQEYAHQKDNQWHGECFVFDHRVAVNSAMEPSKIYSLCPHCGQPARNILHCKFCGKPTKICDACLAAGCSRICSKSCQSQNQPASQK